MCADRYTRQYEPPLATQSTLGTLRFAAGVLREGAARRTPGRQRVKKKSRYVSSIRGRHEKNIRYDADGRGYAAGGVPAAYAGDAGPRRGDQRYAHTGIRDTFGCRR